jgi:hypothetical protein
VPAVRQVVEYRLDERGDEFVGGVGHRGGGERAHAAGVRAGVALTEALVVLRDRQRDAADAVAQRQQRALRAGQALLEQEPSGRRPDRLDRGRVAVGHHDALSGREPVELHDHGTPEIAPPGDRVVVIVERGEARTGDPERRRQLPGPGLRRLQPGELRRRAETGDASPSALVGDAGDQRGLGAGDHQIGVLARCVAQIGGDSDVVAVVTARPGDRLLTAAPADDEDVHQARTPSNASLAWALPTAIG